MATIQGQLLSVADDLAMLEIGRKAIEDALVDWRDSRMSEFTRGNGLVIREKDGKPSDVIRFGPEHALRIGLRAIAAAQHADQPATPAATCENHVPAAAKGGEQTDVRAELQRLYRLITAAHKSIVSGNLDANTFEVSRSAWLNVLKKSNELPSIIALMATTPSDSSEIEQLRTELAAARAERELLEAEVAEIKLVIERVRQVCTIQTKPFMSYTAARYERRMDEFLAGPTGQKFLDRLRELHAKVTPDLNYWVMKAEKAEAELENERAYAQGLREQLKGAGRE